MLVYQRVITIFVIHKRTIFHSFTVEAIPGCHGCHPSMVAIPPNAIG